MNLYLVRHGQAEASWSENRDPGLSLLGCEQASQFARFANKGSKRLTPGLIVSSPLLRAQQTAAPLAQSLDMPVTIASAFAEIPTPDGVALSERLGWLMQCRDELWSNISEPSLLTWRKDLLQALMDLPTDTVVFSHFMVMNAVVGALSDSDRLVCYQPDYCSKVHLRKQGGVLSLLDRGGESSSRVL